MKKFMIIAALGTAALFTACSDDSSSSAASGAGSTQLDGKAVVSCDVVTTAAGISNHSCHAIAADDANVEAFKAKCAPISDMDTRQMTIGAGCADALLACDTQEGGQVEYFYDDASAHVGCEMVGPHNL